MRPPPAGAGPGGRLADLPPLERGLVVYLRMWCTGGERLRHLREDFLLSLGPADGPAEAARLDHFLRLALGAARRPLLRHALECPCYGEDEAMLARLVALAAAGDRDGALALARRELPDMEARAAVALADPLGLAIHRMLGGPIGVAPRSLPPLPAGIRIPRAERPG